MSTDSLWAIVGGAAVILGSLLPWIVVSVSDYGIGVTLGYTISGGARAASAVFGLILVGLAVGMRSRPADGGLANRKGYAYRIPLIVLSVLGFLGYGIFTGVGIVGFPESDGLGGQAHVTYAPSVGLIMMLLGCAAAAFGGISSLRRGGAVYVEGGSSRGRTLPP